MEQTKKPNDPVELLALAGNLSSISDLDFLLQKIGSAAEELLSCEANSIMLLDDSKKNLYFKVATGEKGSALKKMTLPVGKGIAGNVAATREPIIVNDVRSDPRFSAQFDKESGYITRQLMAVPMVARGEIVGVAEVLNRKDNKPFTEVDIKILSNLASLAAAIILNTRIIQDQKNFFSHVLELLSSAIETSKSDMDMHPSHCAYLCCAVAKRMGVGDPDYRFLYYAGLLHDIGYIGMKNKRIMSELALLPTAPPDELHVAVSVRMLEGINIFQGALPIIRHHHENFDGTGFPDKLSGQDIPRGARILRLVEAMEEIRMTGGIRGEELKQNAMREAKDGSGTRFDPAVVDAFINLISEEEKIWEF